jgi:hypothetical protein
MAAIAVFSLGAWQGALPQVHQNPLASRPTDHLAGLVYEDTAFHYHLTLPVGWRRVSNDVVQRNSDKLGIKEHYDALFEAPNRPDFSYPYILVQTIPLGNEHLSPSDLVSSLEASRDEVARTTARPNGFRVNLAKPVYDASKNRVLQEGTSYVPKIGPIKQVSAFSLGTPGVVSLHFYARSKTFARDSAAFHQILDTLAFDQAKGDQLTRSDRRAVLPVDSATPRKSGRAMEAPPADSFRALAKEYSFIVYWLLLGGLLALLARQKNRNWILWGLFGPFAAVISALVLLFLPTLCPRPRCQTPLSDTERKEKRCPRCGYFAAPKPAIAGEALQPSASDSTERRPFSFASKKLWRRRLGKNYK